MEIDDSVLHHTTANWRKLALVIAQVGQKLGRESEDHLEEIAERVRFLVEARLLEARGDLSEWRNCEVRLAEDRSGNPRPHVS